jgi:hypothetical protein
MKALVLKNTKRAFRGFINKLFGKMVETSNFTSDDLYNIMSGEHEVELNEMVDFVITMGRVAKKFNGLSVDPTLTIEEKIQKNRYNWSHGDICTEKFPDEKKDEKYQVDLMLMCFGRPMKTEEIVAELKRKSMRPATLMELMALGRDHIFISQYYPILALGSSTLTEDGRPLVPYLDRRGDIVGISLFDGGSKWHKNFRFLAVKET